MDLHPTFIVGPQGAVVPYTPPPPPVRSLSREERADAYRTGLRSTAELLRGMGFQSLHECEHSYSMTYHGWLLDFRIQRTSEVAHVTNQKTPGKPLGTQNKHGSTTYSLSDEVQSEYVLMITVGKRSTLPPVFVELEESITEPACLIKDSVLNLLASLRQKKLFLPP